MHNVGRGALDIWLRLLLMDAPTDQIGGRSAIEEIYSELRFERFSVNLPTSFDARVVSPGQMCMYFLYLQMYTGSGQLGQLRNGYRYLCEAIENGLAPADHCLGMMQFVFAADTILGEILPERLRGTDAHIRPSQRAAGQPADQQDRRQGGEQVANIGGRVPQPNSYRRAISQPVPHVASRGNESSDSLLPRQRNRNEAIEEVKERRGKEEEDNRKRDHKHCDKDRKEDRHRK